MFDFYTQYGVFANNKKYYIFNYLLLKYNLVNLRKLKANIIAARVQYFALSDTEIFLNAILKKLSSIL